MTYATKYTSEHKDFIKPLWNDGLSAADIADHLNRQFGFSVTRSAIIGLVRRMKLPSRESDGPWRISGQARRLAKMGLYQEPQKKQPVQSLPVPSEAPLAIGPIDDHVDHGCCKWPVNHDGQAFQQCGQPAVDRKPYCLFHRERAKGAQAKHPMTGQSASDRQFRG